MAKKFEAPTRIVLVEWLDACSDDAGWKTWKKIHRQEPMLVRSVGYIVREEADFISLAASVVAFDGTVDGDVTVPRAMVRRVVDLMPVVEATTKAP